MKLGSASRFAITEIGEMGALKAFQSKGISLMLNGFLTRYQRVMKLEALQAIYDPQVCAALGNYESTQAKSYLAWEPDKEMPNISYNSVTRPVRV